MCKNVCVCVFTLLWLELLYAMHFLKAFWADYRDRIDYTMAIFTMGHLL